jgi:creatinine amidohydrolase
MEAGQVGRPVLFEEIGWPDVEAYLKRDDRIMFVTGSCEQHGRHLSYATDYIIPYAIAKRVSEQTGVLVPPPLCFGMSVHHMEFPGTITLQPETWVAVLQDVIRSLHHHGFRRVLLLNGHGGNRAPINVALARVVNEIQDLQVKIGFWWEVPGVTEYIHEQFHGDEQHASGVETALVLAVRPDCTRMERAEFQPYSPSIEFRYSARYWRTNWPSGSVGVDPRIATAEQGHHIIEMAVARYVQELESW